MGRGRLSGRTKEGGAPKGSVNPVHGDTYFVHKMQLFFFFFLTSCKVLEETIKSGLVVLASLNQL